MAQNVATKVRVLETKVIGGLRIFSAWMPGTVRGPAHTIATIDESWYGQIGTDVDPALYAHLPARSIERSRAYNAAKDARYAIAYEAILEAHPELSGCQKDSGEIVTWA